MATYWKPMATKTRCGDWELALVCLKQNVPAAGTTSPIRVEFVASAVRLAHGGARSSLSKDLVAHAALTSGGAKLMSGSVHGSLNRHPVALAAGGARLASGGAPNSLSTDPVTLKDLTAGTAARGQDVHLGTM